MLRLGSFLLGNQQSYGKITAGCPQRLKAKKTFLPIFNVRAHKHFYVQYFHCARNKQKISQNCRPFTKFGFWQAKFPLKNIFKLGKIVAVYVPGRELQCCTVLILHRKVASYLWNFGPVYVGLYTTFNLRYMHVCTTPGVLCLDVGSK